MIIFADAATPLIQEIIGVKSESVRSFVIISIGILLVWFCLN